MDGPVALAVLPDGVAELARLVECLQGQVASLQEQLKRYRQENVDLRQQASSYRTLHRRATERIAQLQQRVQELEAQNRQLRQQAFGRKAEPLRAEVPVSDTNFLKELDVEGGGESKRRRGQQADRPGPKRRKYDHLPERVETIELPPQRQCCPSCGLAYAQREETEDSEQLEIEVKAYRRVWRRRRYQPQCRCKGAWHIVTAPPPAKLIAKSRLGLSVWVEILLDKFASQRPTQRLLQQWRHIGLELAAGTVTEGLRRLAPLFEPLYEALRARQQQGDFWQSDDTRWQVFAEQEGKISHQWWLWVFLSADTVVFVLDHRHSRHVPESHLPNGSVANGSLPNGSVANGAKGPGVMMVDRARAYKAMAQVKEEQIVLAFCWAHVRRDFIRLAKSWPKLKKWAIAWLLRIRELYRRHKQHGLAISHQAAEPQAAEPQADKSQADADQPTRTCATQQALHEHVQQMHRQARSELDDATLRTPCRKVLKSLLKHWPGLTRFLKDPRIPLDNNASERQLRSAVVGRKNYYGSGAIWSGRLAAMLFSLFATLDRCQVNPREWLTGYLGACAAAAGRPPPDWSAWLPWTYAENQAQAPHPSRS